MKSISKFHHMCRVVLPRSCQQTCATNLVGRVLHPSIGTVKHACASRRSTTMRGNIPCSGVPPATLSQQRTHDFPGSLGLRLKTIVRVHTEVHSATSVILHPTLPGHRVASTTVRFSWDHIHLHSMSVLPQHIKKARKQVQPKMCVLKCIAPGMANKRDKHTHFDDIFPRADSQGQQFLQHLGHNLAWLLLPLFPPAWLCHCVRGTLLLYPGQYALS